MTASGPGLGIMMLRLVAATVSDSAQLNPSPPASHWHESVGFLVRPDRRVCRPSPPAQPPAGPGPDTVGWHPVPGHCRLNHGIMIMSLQVKALKSSSVVSLQRSSSNLTSCFKSSCPRPHTLPVKLSIYSSFRVSDSIEVLSRGSLGPRPARAREPWPGAAVAGETAPAEQVPGTGAAASRI